MILLARPSNSQHGRLGLAISTISSHTGQVLYGLPQGPLREHIGDCESLKSALVRPTLADAEHSPGFLPW